MTATLALLLLVALIWFSFALIVAAGLHPALPESLRWVMAVLSAFAGAVILALARLLARRRRLGYYAALAALGLLVVLTFTDDVGLVDLVVLGVTAMPLILLIKDRHWYLGAEGTHAR